MRLISIVFFAVVFFAVIFLQSIVFATVAFAASVDVEFVVDISGSMQQKIAGERQIDIARKALGEALSDLSDEQMVAVRLYAHRVPQSNKAESCKDSELVIPFQKTDKAAIVSKVSSYEPKGYTPIAYSLEQTAKDFNDASTIREAERVIILLSDGEETCGGDPVKVVKDLIAQGFKFKFHTIGFNVNSVARKQLEDIAKAGNGKYFDAKDAISLTSALKAATKEAAVINKEKKSYGESIRGGDNYENAVKIELGKEYKLDHHQKTRDYDYFFFEVSKPAEIIATVNTLDRGIHATSDGKIVEDESPPYAGIQIHDSNRSKIAETQIIGAKFASQSKSIIVKDLGRYYVLVGSEYEPMNGDYSSFTVKLTTRGDLASDVDAGDVAAKALEITPGSHNKNFIGGPDLMDFFKLSLKKGDAVTIGVSPDTAESPVFVLNLYDEFKASLQSLSSGINSGIKLPSLTIDEDGDYYVGLSVFEGSSATEYTLIVKNKPLQVAANGNVEKEGNNTDSLVQESNSNSEN